MSYPAFMPSWAALLRDRCLERSRQQPPSRSTQAYYYEIHKRPVPKSNNKGGHDLANYSYAPPKWKNADEAVEAAPRSPEPIVKAVPIHLLPVQDMSQAGSVVYRPVVLLSDRAAGVQVLHDLGQTPHTTDTQKPADVVEPSRAKVLDDRLTDRLDGGLRSSEYGFFCEDHEPPTRQGTTPYHHRPAPPQDYYELSMSRPPHIPGLPLGAHPRQYRSYEHTAPNEYDRMRYTRSVNLHHDNCPCDRCELDRGNHRRQHRAASHASYRESPTSRQASKYYQYDYSEAHTPTHQRPRHPPRFSVRVERRSNYDRTPSPKRREI